MSDPLQSSHEDNRFEADQSQPQDLLDQPKHEVQVWRHGASVSSQEL